MGKQLNCNNTTKRSLTSFCVFYLNMSKIVITLVTIMKITGHYTGDNAGVGTGNGDNCWLKKFNAQAG